MTRRVFLDIQYYGLQYSNACSRLLFYTVASERYGPVVITPDSYL